MKNGARHGISILLLGVSTVLSIPALAQFPLVNDGVVLGSIDVPGELDEFTFNATAGESIQIRVVDTGDTDFSPQVWLYNPDGTLERSGTDGLTYAIDCHSRSSACRIDQSGTYRLVVGDRYDDVGTYEVYYARILESNENGSLLNDATVTGDLTVGDIDSFVFTANAGESVQIRVVDTGDTDFYPRVWLYNPDGTLERSGSDGLVYALDCHSGSYSCRIDQSGTYRLVIGDRYDDEIGTYEIHYARILESNENGSLINDATVTGDLTVGDIDSFVFTVNAGESVQIRVVDTGDTDFYPRVWLYNPDGTLERSGSDGLVYALDCHSGSYSCRIDQSGTYRLVIGDRYDDEIGTYEIHYARILESNENGSLCHESNVTGDLSVGDIDSFVFTANAGESVQIRVVDTGDTDFYPRVWLYNPDGTLERSGSDGQVYALDCHSGSYSCRIDQSGTYRLVIGDRYDDDAGAYEIVFVGPEQACSGPDTDHRWPVPGYEVNQPSQDYAHFNNGSPNKHHSGLDISAPRDSAVVASAGGIARVIRLSDPRWDNRTHCLGNVVIINHGTLATLYAHLDTITIEDGPVEIGEQIGTVGSTVGDFQGEPRRSCPAVGEHLHFELKDNAVLGTTSDDGEWWGYTPPYEGQPIAAHHPDSWGYRDPLSVIHADVEATTNTVVTVTTAGDGASMRMGPGTNYRAIGQTIVAGEQYSQIGQLPDQSPDCSMGWIQVQKRDSTYFAVSSGGELPDVWVCRGHDGSPWLSSTIASSKFKLKFPISGGNPYTSLISAIFDHSGKPYEKNGRIRAYNGAVAKCEFGIRRYNTRNGKYVVFKGDALTTACDQLKGKEVGPNGKLYAYRTKNRSAMKWPPNDQYMWYDGHPGYDFPGGGDSIVAAADGVLCLATAKTSDAEGWQWKAPPRPSVCKYTSDIINSKGLNAWERAHTFYITHSGPGSGYSTWYLHASSLDPVVKAAITEKGYAEVSRGQVVATRGGWWKGDPNGLGSHLHFEVRKGKSTLVDPYGSKNEPKLWRAKKQ